MKKRAICFFCKKRIYDKKDYVIFSLPRHGFKRMIAHKTCYLKYKSVHPALYVFGNGGVSSFNPFEILNSGLYWFNLSFALFVINFAVISLFLVDIISYYWIYVAILNLAIILINVLIRIYFYIKYE